MATLSDKIWIGNRVLGCKKFGNDWMRNLG